MQSLYIYGMSSIFKEGDRVSVIDDTITGVVVEVKDSSITIKTDDGFPMKFKPSELIKFNKEQKKLSKFIDVQLENLIEKEEPGTKGHQKKRKKNKNEQAMEVDLHIHQLIDSDRNMTNYDMLNLQIETAKNRLEFAIKKKIQRVVFIHGVGEGVLKAELENLLARYNVSVYPASFQKYGFGATEVYIYQKQT